MARAKIKINKVTRETYVIPMRDIFNDARAIEVGSDENFDYVTVPQRSADKFIRRMKALGELAEKV